MKISRRLRGLNQRIKVRSFAWLPLAWGKILVAKIESLEKILLGLDDQSVVRLLYRVSVLFTVRSSEVDFVANLLVAEAIWPLRLEA